MIIDEAKLELIKKDEYTFTDEEVGEIYAMTKSVVKEYLKKSNDFEDVVQTIITKFFSYSIKKFNINKNIKFSTYAFICLKNLTLMEIRCRYRKKNQFYKTLAKLDAPHNEALDSNFDNLIDLIPSDIKSPSETYEDEIKKTYIKSLLQNDELLYDYFVNKLTFYQIAIKNNTSQKLIGKKIKSKLIKLKQEMNQSNFVKETENDDFNREL